MKPRLIEFNISHFCEKARWGLDAHGIAYDREILLPGQHLLRLRGAGLPKTTVPVLLTDAGPIQGSGAILSWAERTSGRAPLAADPARREEAEALEARFDRDIGDDLRRILYDLLVHHPARVRSLWTEGGPAWGPAVLALGIYPMLHALRRQYRLTPERVRASQERFDRCADELDERLARGPWLLGERFTRVDVTACSLLAPLCRPANHPFPWPADGPDELEALEARYRDRPFFRWVQATYRDKRTA